MYPGKILCSSSCKIGILCCGNIFDINGNLLVLCTVPVPGPVLCGKNYVVRGDSFMQLDLAEWLERLTANAEVASVLGSIPAFSHTAGSEGRQMKQF